MRKIKKLFPQTYLNRIRQGRRRWSRYDGDLLLLLLDHHRLLILRTSTTTPRARTRPLVLPTDTPQVFRWFNQLVGITRCTGKTWRHERQYTVLVHQLGGGLAGLLLHVQTDDRQVGTGGIEPLRGYGEGVKRGVLIIYCGWFRGVSSV